MESATNLWIEELGAGVKVATINRRTGGAPYFPLQDKGQPDGRSDFYLVHVTAVGFGREILRARQIEARACKIFPGKPLTYFFVLRPAYRLREGQTQSDQLDRFPFVFILDASAIGIPFHVYPFDTGGAATKVFDEQANDYVFLEDYRLKPSFDAISGHINWAFGSRADYYDGELVRGLEETLPLHESGPRSFLRIAALASASNNKPDERASAVEVAYDRHIPLKGNVKAAVLPRQFLEDPRGDNKEMIDAMNDADVKRLFYNWQPNLAPDEFRAEIKSIVRKYLVAENQL